MAFGGVLAYALVAGFLGTLGTSNSPTPHLIGIIVVIKLLELQLTIEIILNN